METTAFLAPEPCNPHHPLFVYLPGMDGSGNLLHKQVGGLAKNFDVRCLALATDSTQDWDDLSGQVTDLIDRELRESPQRSVYLCGESFGGCLAMKVVARSPQRIHRLILSNPASSFSRRSLFKLAIPLTGALPAFAHRTSSLALLPFLGSLGRIAPRDRRALLEAMQSLPPKTVSWRLSLLSQFDIESTDFSDFTRPVLILAGGADRLLPSVQEAQTLVQKFPNARMVELPHSGHACLLETETDLGEILQTHDFLEPESIQMRRD